MPLIISMRAAGLFFGVCRSLVGVCRSLLGVCRSLLGLCRLGLYAGRGAKVSFGCMWVCFRCR